MSDVVDYDEEALSYDVQLAEDLAGLQADPKFQRVFNGKFVDAFAVTNTMLISQYDVPTRTRTVEKMIARSHFVQFMQEILQDGQMAVESLSAIRADREEDELSQRSDNFDENGDELSGD